VRRVGSSGVFSIPALHARLDAAQPRDAIGVQASAVHE
jgi:hypothetical protein